MTQKSEVYCNITQEELTIKKGKVESLRDRKRYLTCKECRTILESLEWDLNKALEITSKKNSGKLKPV